MKYCIVQFLNNIFKMIKYNFENMNFVVTGAGKGIGRSVLNLLHKNKANVAIITRSKADIKKIQNSFKSKKIIYYVGDVSIKHDVENFFKLVKSKMKKINGLVNNAGIRQREKFYKIDEEKLNYVLDCNLKSVFKVSQLFSQIMSKKTASIVNVSSIVGPRGFADLSGYAMTKAGVVGLSKSLAVELAKKKIRVNTVCPGFIKTSYANNFKRKLPKLYNYTLQRTPLGRWGSSDEVANLILFLLSQESSYITGNVSYVDGGWSSY